MLTTKHGMRSRKGASSLQNLLITAIVLAVIVGLYVFVPPYFNNWKLGNMLRGIANSVQAVEDTERIRLMALEELQSQGYHFEPEQMQVAKSGRIISLRVEYDVQSVVPFTGVVFDFHFTQSGSNR